MTLAGPPLKPLLPLYLDPVPAVLLPLLNRLLTLLLLDDEPELVPDPEAEAEADEVAYLPEEDTDEEVDVKVEAVPSLKDRRGRSGIDACVGAAWV